MRPSANRRAAPHPLVLQPTSTAPLRRGEPYFPLSTSDPFDDSPSDSHTRIDVDDFAAVPLRPVEPMQRRESLESGRSSFEEDEKRSTSLKMEERKLLLASPTTPRTPLTPLTPLPPYSPPRTSFPSSSSPTFGSPSLSRRGSRWTSFNGAGTGGKRDGRYRILWVVLALAVGVFAGWKAGQGGEGDGGVHESLPPMRDVSLIPETIPGRCDPYSPSRPGHLLLHPTNYTLNAWHPLDDGLPACEPTNWMDLLRRSGQRDMGGLREEEWRGLEFLRGKSVVAFGDSVDRDQNEHFCEFVGGKFDMIHAYDPVSPPYPPGEEKPNGAGMQYQLERETSSWPDFGQSRPYVCRVDRLNFTTLNVFHYGLTPEGDWLRGSPHFYPPSALEARFTSLVLPLVRSLFGPSGPSLFSFTPGFWDIMRQVKQDEARARSLAEQGHLGQVDEARLSGWAELSEERREWFGKEYERFLGRVLREWGGEKGSTRVVWRALHQPRPFINAPKNRVATVDQIGRSVVARMLNDDAAKRKPSSDEKTPLKERLYVTNWGRMILGYEHLFRDDIHPNPLPSSWLAWNILLEQVKVQDEVEKRKQERADIVF